MARARRARRAAAALAAAGLLLAGPAQAGPALAAARAAPAADLPAPTPAAVAGGSARELALAGEAMASSDLPAPSRDPDEARRAVREVLAKPEYRSVHRSLPELVVDWVVTQIGRLIVALSGTGTGSLIGIGVLLLVLAGIAVLVVRFSRGMTADPEAAAARYAPPGRSAADWRAEAEAHERAGEWRQAVRCRYRALVADLAGRGLVEEIPGRTAGEYRGEVRRSVPAVADDFASATELFELAWYGGRQTGPPQASSFRALAERVLRQAAS